MSQSASAVQGTVYEAFRESASRHAQREFLCMVPDTAARYGIEPRTYSYLEASIEVAALRHAYAGAGVGHGHRVALMLDNRPEFFFHWLALNALGVSIVPVNAESRSAELEYFIGHSDVALAVVPPTRVRDFAQAAQQARVDMAVATPELSALPCLASPAPLAGTGADVDSECALLYTSGTTGKPKGCVLPNEYFIRAGHWYATVGGLIELAPNVERLITPLPMSHMNAMAFSTMAMMLCGGCIVPLDRFHPSTWWESVRTSRATVAHYLGVMPAMLLGAAPSAQDREHGVRFGFGAGVSPRLHGAFEARFGFPLLEAWAMTETGAGAVIVANREPRKVGSACFGRASPQIECRVVDECGQPVPAGQPGELLVRAAGERPDFGFFREYLKDPVATAQAWEGGYFHTGDIVQVDAEGDFHFIDRKKNVIRRSGENISAVEVESVLLQHPRVAGVGVAPVPDEVRGDEVMACVVARGPVAEAERLALARDVVTFCMERLAYFKAPGYVAFVEQLPLTPTEKIQRARLKELAQSVHATGACVDLRGLKKRSSTT
jgi:acyl-CoA synthetase (AMP-forming)/AMP-acid ligase II